MSRARARRAFLCSAVLDTVFSRRVAVHRGRANHDLRLWRDRELHPLCESCRLSRQSGARQFGEPRLGMFVTSLYAAAALRLLDG